ncbi:MAG: hypothetical protein Q9163_001248 [Psora crenata]
MVYRNEEQSIFEIGITKQHCSAIQHDAKAPLPILDKRAATHIKLGDLDQAFSDAREMVRQEESDAIGYLRLGQILQIQGRPLKALKVYEGGIHRISPKDAHFKTLQGSLNKLSEALAPPKAIDPFRILPEELANMVFAHLHFKDLVIWTDIDFYGARKPVSSSTLREYVKRSRGKVKRLATNRVGYDQKAMIAYVARRCKDLQELYLHGGFVGSSFISLLTCARNLRTINTSPQCEITLKTVTQLLGCCSNLEQANFSVIDARSSPSDWDHHMPKLMRLRLDNGTNSQPLFPLSELLPNIPNIRRLRLMNFDLNCENDTSDFSLLAHLVGLDIAQSSIKSVRLPASLSELKFNPHANQPRTQFLPKLVSLTFSDLSRAQPAFLRDWLEPSKGSLRHLDVSGFQYLMEDQVLSELIEHGCLDNIEQLVLRRCDIGDKALELLAQKAQHLKYLDLNSTRVTGVGVKALASHLKGTLKYLNLNSCKATSVDAVQFARSTGLAVSFLFPSGLRTGQKVRLM